MCSWLYKCLWCIQLLRERLSCKAGKASAIMSKVMMGNGGFYGFLSKPQGVSAWWKETAQTLFVFFSFLVAESPWTSIRQSQTLVTHNANRHCRVRFYTFAGQPLSKQLYAYFLKTYHFSGEKLIAWTIRSTAEDTQCKRYSNHGLVLKRRRRNL